MLRIELKFAPLVLAVSTLFSHAWAGDAPAAAQSVSQTAAPADAVPARPSTDAPVAAPVTPAIATAPVSAPASQKKAESSPSKVAAETPATVPTPTTAFGVTGPLAPNTPISNDTALTPEQQADLWARLRQGFKLGDVDTPAVRQQERFYASKPEYMQRVAERARRYLYFITGEVEKRGMPTEIALLPIVESAFVPKAQSSALASGLWQFIPSTGQRYGLERTWWYDGRQDVMAATYAALDYLQDLYNQFGDWQLALAAYNWGEGGVGRALAKTRAKGLEDSFDTIHKPHETESYVPKLIAIRNLIAHPEAYGLTLPDMPNKPYFEPVSTGRHIDVQLVAKLADTSVEELLHLNPGLIRPVFAYKDDRKLLLPADKVQTFETNLEHYDKPLLSWQPYVTKRGESLQAVSDRFGISLAELRDVNKLGNGRAGNGQTILVPIRSEVDASDRQNLAALIAGAAASAAEAPSGKTDSTGDGQKHKVARGETLFSIAKQYGVKPEQLKALNHLHGTKVAVGQVLQLQATSKQASVVAAAKPARGAAIRYVVVHRGDTLDEIARKHDVTVAELKRWNKGAGKALRVGYKLEIRTEG